MVKCLCVEVAGVKEGGGGGGGGGLEINIWYLVRLGGAS